MTTDLADLLGDQESTALEFEQSFSSRDKIGQEVCRERTSAC
ncbi:hypothetical protein ACFHYQ_18610 [Sphaerimonospora cavernae]|uniref:Uncharacterized protein n=1 Tax=Sphaerimonospora cavernae TaxID=1740611 RepID=A0ABV6U779_9ACTN